MDNEIQKRKAVPQDWEPPKAVRAGYKIWRGIFAAFKIALGALSTVLLIVLVSGFVFAGMLGDFLQDDILPEASLDLSDLTLDLNSVIYYVDSDNQIQIQQEIDAQTDRKWASYEEIPEDMIHAAIAVEDHRFYRHQGVDWVTTIQACARMFFGDSSVGGSSITQQLIKNTFGNSSVTVQRKLLEIFQATQMEKRYDKQTILEYYLNVIYLGQNCNGVKAAAETYYGKELEKLTAAECASIIGITNSPTYYDPYQNPENNRSRTETILWLMRNQGYLTEEEYQTELNRELVLKAGIDFEDTMAQCANTECGYRDTVSTLTQTDGEYYCPQCGQKVDVVQNNSSGMYSYHTEAVVKDVAKALAEQDGVEWNDATQEFYMQRIQNGGYHIYSTLDWDVQQQVEEIYCNMDNIPSVRGGQQLQSAIVVINNQTGDIVALAGGTGEKTDYYGWDRTSAELQSGSSIKPISVYGPAFEMGVITPATVVKDLPLNYDDGSNWPRNDNWVYNYSRTIYSAVTSSVNACCAWTLDMIGTDYSYDFAKNKFGLHTLIEEYIDSSGTYHSDNAYAPLAMGAQTWGVTVRDMAAAFATYANEGVYREARTFTKVFDSDGNLVIDNVQESEQIVSKKTVDYMNYCLVNATANGTGYEANLSYSHGITTAGKTGTTTGNKARWYCGFTGYYTAAVWTGFDQPDSINALYVNNPAATLFKKVMGPLHSGKKNIALYDSSAMKGVTVCLDSGKLATDACKLDIRSDTLSRLATSAVYAEDYPTEECDKHVLVDYCSCGGVANEYCKLFAEVDSSVTVEQKALVKLTADEIAEIYKAGQHGLVDAYLSNDWIYQINDDGTDGVFKGLNGKLQQSEDAPYLVCPEHTKAAWEAYQNSHPTEPEPSEPAETVPETTGRSRWYY